MFMLSVTVLFLVLGALLDTLLMLLIIIPILMPTVRELGIDPVLFRCRLDGQHDDRPDHAADGRAGLPDRRHHRHQGRGDSRRNLGCFLIMLIVALFVLVFVPQITLWLPDCQPAMSRQGTFH